MKKLLTAIIALSALAGNATAQEMRPVITLETAQTITTTCLAHAVENDMVIGIAVFDHGGVLKSFAAMDGLATAIVDVAMWKGKSAATYGFATAETANWGGAAPGIAVWAGGLPVYDGNGVLLGGVGVSGADSDDDVACVRAGIEAAGLSGDRP